MKSVTTYLRSTLTARSDEKIRTGTASRRRGFAVKELLLVLGAVGSGVIALKIIDPISDEQRTPFVGQLELLMEREVLLSDGFVCIVEVDRFSSPDAQAPSLYRSRLQFAVHEPYAGGAFLFEVLTTENHHWHTEAHCKTWSFLHTETFLENLNQGGGMTAIHSELSPEQQLAVDLQLAPDRVQMATALADPLWHCVPPELQEAGILAVTRKTGLDYLHELDDFPLSRLGLAIRTAARKDDWTQDDPQTLFPPKTVTTLSDDQQLKLAQSLVYRLLADLPEESSP